MIAVLYQGVYTNAIIPALPMARIRPNPDFDFIRCPTRRYVWLLASNRRVNSPARFDLRELEKNGPGSFAMSLRDTYIRKR